MKKLILIIVVTGICILQVKAQAPVKTKSTVNRNVRPIEEQKRLKVTPEIRNHGRQSSCCSTNPNTLTACSQSLFQSFRNLTAGTGVRNCHPTLNYPSASYAMPENCFSWQTTSTSMVTFTSFYVPKSDELRAIWGSTAANFSYYGACAPEPIIFPHPGGKTENHVFAAKLIRQSDYMAFAGSPKNYTTMAAVPALSISDIQQIVAVYIEETGGYISTSEAAEYSNMASSKGIIVKARLRGGATVLCYVINNYDGAGTITWKEKNPACIK